MVIPPMAAVCGKNVVENHHAETQHDELPDVAHVKCGVKSIGFERFPLLAIFIAEGADILTKNIP